MEKCPSEEAIRNFKGKLIALKESDEFGFLMNEEEHEIFKHVKICETCKKVWDE